MTDSDQPKIIVDDDWKSSAQAEKAKLAAQEQEKAQKAEESSGLPEKLGFKELISMLATQALMYMGAFPDQTGRAMVSLDVARLNIDLLSVVDEKTKGNLTEEESAMLTQTIAELQHQFVEVSKAVAQAAQDGTLEQMGQTPAAGGGPDLKFSPDAL
jgi:ATP-dependent protease Clp ATPase subunit